MNAAETECGHFAVCLDNEGYPASLEVGKLYRFIPDKEAEAEGLVRIVDECGEDYAFEARRFYPVPLPTTVQEALSGGKSGPLGGPFSE